MQKILIAKDSQIFPTIAKDSHIFSTKTNIVFCNIYILNFKETLTNDAVNFKQPAPDCYNTYLYTRIWVQQVCVTHILVVEGGGGCAGTRVGRVRY